MLDRIDLQVDVPAVSVSDLGGGPNPASERSEIIARRVEAARSVQAVRQGDLLNAHLSTADLDTIAVPDAEGRDLLSRAAEQMKLSARGYHRLLRVARTIADLQGGPETLSRAHIAEALSYRRLKTA
jgi:magnesium chelatase family protein